jgi:transcriptional regulator with XRE-family HTH domain
MIVSSTAPTSALSTTAAIPRNLGERLRHYREIAGLTREEVAIIMGRSAGAIRDWELGQRSPSAVQVAKLARAYDIPATELTAAE